jgi:hypothetical protein
VSNYLMRGFYSRLNADTGSSTNPVRTAVSDRIYAVEAPASSTLPLVVYSMDSPDTERFFSGIVRSRALFTVSVFGKVELGPDAVADIDRKVFDLLDQQAVTVTGHDRGYIRGVSRGTPTAEGEYFRSDSTFELVATTTS